MNERPGWRGRLALHYRVEGGQTTAHDRHEGPLRVLQRLYPEGPAICHHVLVHPPGGIVGGDELDIDVALDEGSHALITTPGATRFYRSSGARAVQQATLRAAARTRLEWLPLETIAYDACEAENRVRLELAPGAEMIGWDVLALGLAAAGQPFRQGRFVQHLAWPGVWLERGVIAAADERLLHSPLGLAGHPVLATMWFASGAVLAPARRQALLDSVRGVVDAAVPAPRAGATSPDARLVVLRVLADRVEPVMSLLGAVRAAWRREAWALEAPAPRVWRT
jgi:urease accessory protein